MAHEPRSGARRGPPAGNGHGHGNDKGGAARTARIAQLCDEDKRKIARMIEQLALITAENERLEGAAEAARAAEAQAWAPRVTAAETAAAEAVGELGKLRSAHETLQTKYNRSLLLLRSYQNHVMAQQQKATTKVPPQQQEEGRAVGGAQTALRKEDSPAATGQQGSQPREEQLDSQQPDRPALSSAGSRHATQADQASATSRLGPYLTPTAGVVAVEDVAEPARQPAQRQVEHQTQEQVRVQAPHHAASAPTVKASAPAGDERKRPSDTSSTSTSNSSPVDPVGIPSGDGAGEGILLAVATTPDAQAVQPPQEVAAANTAISEAALQPDAAPQPRTARQPRAAPTAVAAARPIPDAVGAADDTVATAASATPTAAPDAPRGRMHSAATQTDGPNGGVLPEEKLRRLGGKVAAATAQQQQQRQQRQRRKPQRQPPRVDSATQAGGRPAPRLVSFSSPYFEPLTDSDDGAAAGTAVAAARSRVLMPTSRSSSTASVSLRPAAAPGPPRMSVFHQRTPGLRGGHGRDVGALLQRGGGVPPVMSLFELVESLEREDAENIDVRPAASRGGGGDGDSTFTFAPTGTGKRAGGTWRRRHRQQAAAAVADAEHVGWGDRLWTRRHPRFGGRATDDGGDGGGASPPASDEEAVSALAELDGILDDDDDVSSVEDGGFRSDDVGGVGDVHNFDDDDDSADGYGEEYNGAQGARGFSTGLAKDAPGPRWRAQRGGRGMVREQDAAAREDTPTRVIRKYLPHLYQRRR